MARLIHTGCNYGLEPKSHQNVNAAEYSTFTSGQRQLPTLGMYNNFPSIEPKGK